MENTNENQVILPIAVMIGVTGLVGRQLLSQLLESGRYREIYAVVRKRFELSAVEAASATQVTWLEIPDFTQLKDTLSRYDFLGADVFSSLGSTQKQAGSKAAFYQIDHDYNLAFAEVTRQQGARHFLIVSAMGADAKSLIFYNRVKGELELDIQQIGFEYYSIFRPSLLLGQHKDARLGESVAQSIFTLGQSLLPKTFYACPITGEQVAFAMSQVSALKSKSLLDEKNATASLVNVYSNKMMLCMS